MALLKTPTAQIVKRVLAEAEHDCTKHTFVVRVRYVCDPKAKKRRLDIIAALLRVLADHTDGWCATRHAIDADLPKPGGIAFHFSTDKKRGEFITRIALYMEQSVVQCLRASKV